MTTFINLDTPIYQTTETVYRKFLIKNITVNINSSATIIVLLYPNIGNIVSRVIKMEGVDYSNWGSDDNYLIAFIKMNLELEDGIY